MVVGGCDGFVRGDRLSPIRYFRVMGYEVGEIWALVRIY